LVIERSRETSAGKGVLYAEGGRGLMTKLSNSTDRSTKPPAQDYHKHIEKKIKKVGLLLGKTKRKDH